MCWTLPAEGFEALHNLETSVVPGLPRLARDMMNDKMLSVDFRGTPFAKEMSVPLCDGDRSRRRRVVVPGLAGIIFASFAPAAALAAARRGSSFNRSSSSSSGGGGGGRKRDGGNDGADVREEMVLARLEQDEGTVVCRFVLEDFGAFRGDDAGAGSRRKGRVNKRGSTRGCTRRRVTLPVTYVALLEEATSPCPSPGDSLPSVLSVLGPRWGVRVPQ